MALNKYALRNWLLESDWNWQDSLYSGMILASLAGLLYAFNRN
jgi:hypothetical protein